MRSATSFLAILIWACGDESADPAGKPAVPATNSPAASDPFQRLTPEGLTPSFDRAVLECDGAGWLVDAELAGRADSARAVIVRTDGELGAWDLALEALPVAEGSLWQPFRYRLEDPAAECDRYASAVVIEARDAAGATVDCVAFGPGAADLVAGRLDDRLQGVSRGSWSGCRVR